uniref:Putative secreted protein n=1 Tax=Ixodes ricinus TaxID=34613 RepID=A0A6B0TTP3_IXORI
MGSTASTVAITSSVLCLRLLTCIRPSRLPQTNTRPPGPTKPSSPERTKACSVTARPSGCRGCILNTLFDRPWRPQ